MVVAVTVTLAMGGCGSATGDQGGGSPPSSAPSVPAGALVVKVVSDSQNVGAFQPPTATANVGQIVAWVFEDPNSQHTVTADDGSFDSGTQSSGFVFSHTFRTPGTYAYHCTLHAGMKGQVTVK